MILLSPHDDDNALYASFTCIREKPLVVVVTDSWIQPNRGEKGCSAQERAEETRKACETLGCRVFRLGIKDTELNEWNLKEALKPYLHEKTVYAPAIQGGNFQHDLVGRIAKEIFGDVIQYTTYTKTELWTKGDIEIIPTEEENGLKKRALAQYFSQLQLPSVYPHFVAVINKSEWLIKNF